MPSSFIVRSFLILSVTIFQSYFCQGQDMPSGQLILPDKHFKVPFKWKGDSINGQWENYAAMLIPVKLDGCPKQFYMQFDLGVPYSLFYRNKLKAINNQYPLTVHIPDSSVAGMKFSFVAGLALLQEKQR
jgi:hypothetical protein